MSLRKAPKVDEARIQRVIRGGGRGKAVQPGEVRPANGGRSTILLRLQPDVVERLDAVAAKLNTNRHALIVQLIEEQIEKARKAK